MEKYNYLLGFLPVGMFLSMLLFAIIGIVVPINEIR